METNVGNLVEDSLLSPANLRGSASD